MKKKAMLLSLVGATVLTLGLQSQQAFANTYSSRVKGTYSYRNKYKIWNQYSRSNGMYYFKNNCNIPEVTKPAPTTPAPTVDASLNEFEAKVVELTNAERAKQGLPALKVDSALSKVARTKSQDIKDKNYFDHNSPTYGSPFDMMKQFGISYRSAGENIAKGQRTPEEVVNAWMNSPGHRANILGNYTHIGVGYVSSGNVWTQMFISK